MLPTQSHFASADDAFKNGKNAVWRSVAKSPKTFQPTCTVSQQLGVPDCNASENHLQELSRTASGNGVRLHSQHLRGSSSLVGCMHEDIRGQQQST